MTNDVYFSTNGPYSLLPKYGGRGLKQPNDTMFRMWHPRDSITTQSSTRMSKAHAQGNGELDITLEFEVHARRIRKSAAALLPLVNDSCACCF